jgi:enoyl-CoA hydratase/carnithine racemase
MTAVLLVDEAPGGIRVLTLNRPERLNSFTAEGYRLLAAALREAAADETVRVVLLRGAGRAFSSGVDLDALAGTPLDEMRPRFAALLGALIDLPQPLVAAVQGPAVGFGMTILLHADVVLVADDARFRAPFTALGTAPEAASSVLLPAVVGTQRAADIILTGRWVPAEEAVAIGLAARVVPRAELEDAGRAVTGEMAAAGRAVLVAGKALLRAGRAEAARDALVREDTAARALWANGALGGPR